MNDLVILLTKDCMPKEALPCYGGCKYWMGKTPNIDALAEKGTMFTRYYTVAGSTAMSMSAMLTGKYPFEFKTRSTYKLVDYGEFQSIYDIFQKEGYECHIIWEKDWKSFATEYVGEFGDWNRVIYHGIDIDQATDCHPVTEHIHRNEELLRKSIEGVCAAFDSIDLSKKQFVWCHIPHIMKGRTTYMEDMDAFDEVVGYARKVFGDSNIYLSTDHGHMNMHKHISGYGFDVYEPIINIPLITPRIDGLKVCDRLLCNIDLPVILLNNKMPLEREVIYSDTKYYAQLGRRMAVVSKRYKFIYNAEDEREELYDVIWDPDENYNIHERYHYDKDRHKIVFYDEHYFYPYKEEAMHAYEKLKASWKEVWREPSKKQIARTKIVTFIIRVRNKLFR